VKRVLIVLLGALGDVVRGFSILPPLKAHDPSLHITWLVEPKSAGIVKLHPLVDEVLIFDRPYRTQSTMQSLPKQLLASVRSLKSMRDVLNAHRFDVVLDMQRHLKSGFFSWLTHAPLRVGFRRGDAKEGNWLFNNRFIEPIDNSVSKVLHYQQFLPSLGIPIPDAVRFGLREAVSDADLPSLLHEERVSAGADQWIGVVMGSTWDTKNWPVQGYIKLLPLLLARHANSKILLLGDKTQAALGQQVAAAMTTDRVVNLAGSTSLKELLAVLARCTYAVGPDSGPGHLCAAVGTPYIGLFGPTTEARVAPFGQEHLVVRADIGCAPCMRRVCPGLDTLCMRLLTPELVLSRVASLGF